MGLKMREREVEHTEGNAHGCQLGSGSVASAESQGGWALKEGNN
jgi:hypothetical protein